MFHVIHFGAVFFVTKHSNYRTKISFSDEKVTSALKWIICTWQNT